MRFAVGLVLVFMCVALRAEQGSQISASRITIVGVAKGGTYSIGYASGSHIALSVQTVAGETPEQVVAKLVAEGEKEVKGGFHANGPDLVVTNSSPGRLFARSTDPGLPVPPNVSKFQIRPDKATGEAVLTWEVPNPSPSIIYIRCGGRMVARVLPTTTTFRDASSLKGLFASYSIHCGYFPNEETYQFSDITRVACENPKQLESVDLAIYTRELPNGTVGEKFESEIQKTGGISPATWKLFAGKLPEGIEFKADGSLVGTPTKTGEFPFEVQVTDAEGSIEKRVFSIRVK